MGKIKFTKGELKRQRDALKQYERYLPTLQLKKQQLQLEILHHSGLLEKKELESETKYKYALTWSAFLTEEVAGLKGWLKPEEVLISSKNVAGVDVPVFQSVRFGAAEYDLFVTPLWVDPGLEALKELVSLEKEIQTVKDGISILRHELRITTQRVNLFEKIMIPRIQANIKKIKVFLSDQQLAAVCQAKVAKRKIIERMAVG